MGDLQVCCSSLPTKGIIKEEGLSTSPSSSSLSSSSPPSWSLPDPLLIDDEVWSIAEHPIQDLLSQIQPTRDSKRKRNQVIHYVQTLIRRCLGFEVFPYGSVPLKTYLPDGDIDLTALSNPNVEDCLASQVLNVLKHEERNEAAEYEVKDVQFISAEIEEQPGKTPLGALAYENHYIKLQQVKLVKCLVQNVVVDISFNQLGGLCTLCFLEQVDGLVGKDHLFKRSIILIKAWCYYESRILGAHHGLISTYALETLVLYVFHLFHSSLNGPLSVLYRFLYYFSKFDWENYCISLSGPVCKSSLPNIMAEMPTNDGHDMLLQEEFLRNCLSLFSVPRKGHEANNRTFPLKHLNIVDPLKENNNLGRSVNRGNFFRIRSAFKFGARKLGWILSLPRRRIDDELKKFFANTLERHGSKFRGYAQNYTPNPGFGGHCTETLSNPKFPKISFSECDGVCGMEDKLVSGISNEPERCYVKKVGPSQIVSDANGIVGGDAFSRCPTGDAKDMASRFLGCRTIGNKSDSSPELSYLNLNLKSLNGTEFQRKPVDGVIDEGEQIILPSESRKQYIPSNSVCSYCNGDSRIWIDPASLSAALAEGSDAYFGDRESDGTDGSTEASNFLSDLSGDYKSHFRSLLYGYFCHGYVITAPVLSSPPMSPQYQKDNSFDFFHGSIPFKQNFSKINRKSFLSRQPFYPVCSASSNAVSCPEEKQKSRGTGTFLPNMFHRPHQFKPSPGKARSHASGNYSQLQTEIYSNGFASISSEKDLSKEGSPEQFKVQVPASCNRNPALLDYNQTAPSNGVPSAANATCFPSEKLEFGSLGDLPYALQVGCTRQDSGTHCPWGSARSIVAQDLQKSHPLGISNHERAAEQSYHLKDEDFPPLSLRM
ncbi:hypothetical protein RJ641_032670 [Dillenia turbinata]|uniref:Polymerase nucleotidyl transferase domain-containing protein n=1 Tax=Dillenia turbinata TaxID=194707 RepID=A0AAN8ZIM8_9MAGN